ncbi:hypothetical protein QTG54_014057 [Skeletonema marinoi]|uniref:Uncharacterized protein n=1 Tax=Skeletonema marinoi TaxID=267567 RepID=A0AAD8XXD8_9STRA|nr:hypothetical protein QTG54_014057 [Skeletonema marinoi]
MKLSSHPWLSSSAALLPFLYASSQFLLALLSVGGVAASQDLLLRGSKTSDRQLGKPTNKCKNSLFATCASDTTCQQCCECECDGATVEKAKQKCSEGCEVDEVTAVGGDCATTCGAVCDP